MVLESFEIVRVLVLTTVAFAVAVAWTPALAHILYKFKLGKRIRDEVSAPIFSKLHAKKAGTPTMGGVLVWVTLLILAILLWQIQAFWPQTWIGHLSFLSRTQTLLPLGVLVASALVGLADDYFNVRGIGPNNGGLRMRDRLFIYAAIAAVGAWWFAFKLDWDLLHLPFLGDFNIGWWYIPFFLLVIVATSFSVNETDGLDGLAGGTLLTSFGAYAVIAFSQGRYDLAVFCGVLLGGLLAFLWFNIPPARFIMGDTGAMSLGVTLGVVALLTNTAFLLPVIGSIFVLESFSVIVQMFWKKVFKRKWILSAPFHHHLEAIGWPESKIVMRAWVVSMVSAGLGTALVLLDALSH
ncbi:MAG TPA: phospho-N-acetylmuramoyl-pentapeptide-transferase [Patescibacteria group bacterium]|nr:phospho-N-acetylmuramoyl-pentapeptide-transferase [Patescibacteria group bacterium]